MTEERTSPESALRALLTSLSSDTEATHEFDPHYLESLLSLIRATEDVSERDVSVAGLVHTSLRSFAVNDGAPPEDMPVLSAPDLQIERAPRLGESLIQLPKAEYEGPAAHLVALLNERRSMPYFSPEALTLSDLANLLEGALGTRELLSAYNRRDLPLRRFPSAGGLQPLDFQLVVRRVESVEPGIYQYNPVSRSLSLQEAGEFGVPLVEATLQTDWVFYAPVVVAIVGRLDRCHWKYGSRGYRYLNVDCGCAYLNLHLMAESLELFGNAVAAFDDDKTNSLFRLDGIDQFVNLLFAVGHRPSRWGSEG